MVVYTKIIIGGTAYFDYLSANVTKSISSNNTSGSFEIELNNHNGLYASTFSVNDEVVIYAAKDFNVNEEGFPMNFPFSFSEDNRIFVGRIEDIEFQGQGSKREIIMLRGSDYMSKLRDATVEPIVYNNTELSVIVKDIISNSVSGITTTNVVTTTKTIDHISFNHISVFDALKLLAGDDRIFYVDNDKDLHFELKATTSSGQTLDSTNVTRGNLKTSGTDIVNQVWVYGGKVLTGYRDEFTADGGSVYTLDYKPHNTIVLVGGSTVPKVGGIAELNIGTVGSPTQYLVDFDQRKIIFVSGTSAGNNIPVSGTDAITVDYQRNRQIVKFGQDDISVANYDKKPRVIVDSSIIDPNYAKRRVIEELKENSSPAIQGTVFVNGIVNLTPSNTVQVNLPFHNQNNVTYEIIEVSYKFNPQNNRSDNVLTVKLNKRIIDLVDTIKQMKIDIKQMQSQEIFDSENITRLFYSTGSMGLRVKSWNVKTRSIGNSFVLGHPINGKLGSPAVAVNGSQITLGSTSAGAFTIQVSGGEA